MARTCSSARAEEKSDAGAVAAEGTGRGRGIKDKTIHRASAATIARRAAGVPTVFMSFTFHIQAQTHRLSGGQLPVGGNFVGRTPWSARDAPVPLFSRRIKSCHQQKAGLGAGGPKGHPRGR